MTTLRNCHGLVERHIQDLFDQLRSRACTTTRIAAAPRWMIEGHFQDCRRVNTHLGYSFTPDARVQHNRVDYLIELKLGSKYEPIALAEALHHAFMFTRADLVEKRPKGVHKDTRAVVVTQYSPWLRAALQKLYSAGLRRDQVTLLEHSWYQGGSVVWFDAPLASARKCVEPTTITRAIKKEDPKILEGLTRWWKIDETSSYIASSDQFDAKGRAFSRDDHAVVSRYGTGERSVPGGWVCWRGAAQSRGRAIIISEAAS